MAYEVGDAVIRMCRQYEIDLDAAPCGERQRREQGGVRHEVGRHRQNPPLRRKAAGDQHDVDGVVGPVGAARHQLRQRKRCASILDFCRSLWRRLLAGERPVLFELLPRLFGDFAKEIEAEIEPRLAAQDRAWVALEVLGGEISPAAPQVLAVGNHHLAVVAQVGSPALGRAEGRDEAQDVYSCCLQAFHVRIATEVDADAVDQQTHAHTFARPLFEALGDLVAEYVAADEERGNLDRMLRAIDRRAQGVQRLRAVFMHREALVRNRIGNAHGHA